MDNDGVDGVSRREFLQSATAAGIAPALSGEPAGGAATARRPVAVASANGLRAIAKAVELIGKGTDLLDAAVEGVAIVEEDPSDMSVGYGGIPNEVGVVELDASVMHGPTHRAGAVAGLRGIKTPSRVAKLVMQRTDHLLLVGCGALEFAKSFGFKEENLLTENSRKIWLHWRATRGEQDNWLPAPDGELDPVVRKFFGIREHGTVHVGVLDDAGNLAGVTSTSGLYFKLPGRVGDSPIIGAGLYVDNDVGSCGSTGRGEANLLNCSSFLVVEHMRRGLSPRDACLEVLQRIADKTEPRLVKAPGRPNFDLKFYALNKQGEYAGVAMWKGSQFALYDGKNGRLEDCAYLLE
jgi:N4-(beta-N-acetylglucosaminyl)-L-asparaginase